MANLEAMADSSPTAMVLEGLTPRDVLEKILAGMGPINHFEPRRPMKFPDCCNLEKVGAGGAPKKGTELAGAHHS